MKQLTKFQRKLMVEARKTLKHTSVDIRTVEIDAIIARFNHRYGSDINYAIAKKTLLMLNSNGLINLSNSLTKFQRKLLLIAEKVLVSGNVSWGDSHRDRQINKIISTYDEEWGCRLHRPIAYKTLKMLNANNFITLSDRKYHGEYDINTPSNKS